MSTGPKASIEFARIPNERLFYCYVQGIKSNWYSVHLHNDWEGIPCDYHDYTGKDSWEEVAAILNVAEPAFKAQHKYHSDPGDFISVQNVIVLEKFPVERLEQLLVELEPRFTCYSVPKLTRLIMTELVKPRYNMRAVIEF
ncbi:g8503 [Coccomyxa elongata]